MPATAGTSKRPLPQGAVKFADPDAPGGADTTPRRFLADCRKAAAHRFGSKAGRPPTYRTFERSAPLTAGSPASRRVVRLQVARSVLAAWHAAAPGEGRDKRRFVDAQVALILDDLLLQPSCAFLPMAPRDVQACAEDAGQAVHEALGRTQLGRLEALPPVTWEGTLVTSVAPTSTVVVLSVG